MGIDSIDPSTWSVGGERLRQSFEEVIELGSGLALLTSVLCRLLGLLDGHLQPVRQGEPAGSTTKLTAEAPCPAPTLGAGASVASGLISPGPGGEVGKVTS